MRQSANFSAASTCAKAVQILSIEGASPEVVKEGAAAPGSTGEAPVELALKKSLCALVIRKGVDVDRLVGIHDVTGGV